MKKNKKQKNLIGDIFDLINGNTNFVTPKMFHSRHQDITVDYDHLQIEIGNKYVLKLIEL